MVIILNVYLVYLNISSNEYNTINETRSTANYIEVKEELEEEIVEEEVIIEVDPIVYDGKTLEELSETLNKSLSSTISNKGYLIASYSLEKGVDPYVALSIILLESGCNSGRCSGLTRNCYNVGGQKGSPGCNGGSYKAFSNIDEGIKSFVDNLATYYARGLNTPEKMNSRYAESQVWAQKVRNYMSSISRK